MAIKTHKTALGRQGEYLATRSEDEKRRTGTRAGSGVFSDIEFKTFPTRNMLAQQWRKAQRGARERGAFRPLIALADGEGF
jgi:hypothetical protein